MKVLANGVQRSLFGNRDDNREVFSMFIIGPRSLSRAIPGYRLVLVCWLGKSHTTFGGSITLILVKNHHSHFYSMTQSHPPKMDSG